jgi:hypothetical protein
MLLAKVFFFSDILHSLSIEIYMQMIKTHFFVSKFVIISVIRRYGHTGHPSSPKLKFSCGPMGSGTTTNITYISLIGYLDCITNL